MDKIKVLLAEDELALAHIVRESLEQAGFEVTLCANGDQALQKYREHKPDVLALDVMMSKMDGFQVARKIREADKVTPIIFLTAKSQPKDVMAGFESGANDYLKKPFSVEELIVRMQVLLSANRLLVRQTPNTPPNEKYQISNLQLILLKILCSRALTLGSLRPARATF
jgi:DNA-binding response OmpR family regulator